MRDLTLEYSSNPGGMKRLIFLVLTLFLSYCLAANVSVSTHEEDLRAMKIFLMNGKGIGTFLKRFNGRSKELLESSSRDIPENYFQVKEEVICLIMKHDSIVTFDCPEIKLFYDYFIKEIKKYEYNFSPKHKDVINSFLTKALNMCKIHDDFMESHITARIEALKFEEVPDQDKIYTFLYEFVNDCGLPDVKCMKIMISQVLNLRFDEHPEWLSFTLSSLVKFIFNLKNSKDPKMWQNLIDLVLSECVINALEDETSIDNYSIIFHLLMLKPEFTVKLESLSSDLKQKIKDLTDEKVGDLIKIYKLLNFVSKLRVNSHEIDYNLAFRALKTLREMCATQNLAKELMNLDFDTVRRYIFSISDLLRCEINKMHLNASRVVLMMGMLHYDCVSGNKKQMASSNAVTGLGYILRGTPTDSTDYPNDYIKEVKPKLEEMLQLFLSSIAVSKIAMTYNQFLAILNVFKLTPNEIKRQAFIDQFCTHFISDIPSQIDNSFIYLNSITIGDRRGVYVTGFLSFLQSYLSNPNSSKLWYLKDFFQFLKYSNLLSKSELLFIETRVKIFDK